MICYLLAGSVGLIYLNSLSLPTLAQTSPDIPANVRRPTWLNTAPLPDQHLAPVLTPSLAFPQVAPFQASTSSEAKVQIKRFDVLGSTVFSAVELNRVLAPWTGKNLNFEQLAAVRTAITDMYVRKGYLTSGAFLPNQDTSRGVLQVQVVEGELEEVEILGLRRLKKSYVRDRLALATQPPLNIPRLQEKLQLLQSDPRFRKVQAELVAGTTPGRNVLVLKLLEAPLLSTSLATGNREAPSVGSLGASALLSSNNLLGLGDRLNTQVGFTEGINSYNISYEIPVNARDGMLSLGYSNGRSRVVEAPFTPLDINGRTQTYSLGFRQPLSRTPTSEFALGLAADLRRSRTYLFDDEPFSFVSGPEDGKSRVSVLRFSQDWVNRNSTRVLAARSQFSVGLNAFDATVNDTGTDGRFFDWIGQAQWVQALNKKNDAVFVLRGAIQLTPDSLLPLEQFSIGGIDTVRGYRENQRVGDNGIVGSAELRFPIIRDTDGFGLLQLTPFLDVGTSWSNNDESVGTGTLLSTGLGLRWQLGSRFGARLDWGIPLVSVDKQGDSLQDNGLHFAIDLQPF